MKTLLRLLKSFWFLVPVLWLASLAVCWFVAPRVSWLRDYTLEAMAIISAFYLLLIVLRQYKRIRTEHNLENLVQIEVDRSLKSTGEFRDQQVLRERLKHAIAMLRTDRSAGGGGSSALYDLPWYLVIGMSAAGKTSLLTRSGLSASIASSANEHQSGTQHCDWYFSPEAVMIDTAGRYLRDDQSASEFAGFLRMLKKQRSKAAVNGLVLVVSLPELLASSASERNDLAARLVSRIEEYTECLDANPPIYLMLSKTDQLPGFSQAFEGLDLHERQQPLGMTFGLSEIRSEGLRSVLDSKLENLQGHVRRYVDAQIIALGADANSALLNFPNYFAELSVVLEQFLQHFARSNHNGAQLLLRGLYFTSALQTDKQLAHVYEDSLADSFALRPEPETDPSTRSDNIKTGERSYFITDTFRRVIFPDRDLTLYQSRFGRDRSIGPIIIAVALFIGLAFIGLQALSFQNNREWLASLSTQLTELKQSPDRAQRLASGEGLELLRNQLAAIEKYRTKGVPLQLSGGLYRGDDIYLATQNAYLQQLRTQALEPITMKLQLQMREFNEFAKTMDPQYGFGATPARPDGKTGKARAQGKKLLDRTTQNIAAGRPTSLGSIPRSTSDVTGRLTGAGRGTANQTRTEAIAALRNPATANDAAELSATTGGLSLSEEMLGRLDERQVESIIESYNALKLYLILTQPSAHPETEFVDVALPVAWSGMANQANPISEDVIQDNSPVYVQLLKNGQAPALPRNEQLIDETRKSLKFFMISSSLVDREYLRLQLESSRQFPAIGLNDLVPMPGRQLLYGSEAVPAIFTRQGWEEFVKPELIKMVSGNLRNETDWVLDGEGGDSVVQKANFVREFMARYKRDYTQAWYTMVDSVGVRRFTDMANATQQLSLLSDVRNSPVKLLLSAVNDNTQWDVPAPREAQQVGVKRDDGFWGKVSGIFDNKEAAASVLISPLPAVDDGSLAKRFEPVSRVFAAQNAEGADSTIMDRYLAALRKLKVRMNNIQRSQDVGKSSKQLISETLEGQPSEVTSVRNYVETTVDTSQGGLSNSLQSLFSLPIQFAWETLRDPAGEQIAKAWAQQVAKPWEQVMAHRYPISADSRNEASVKDLQRFVDPESGLLPNFKRNEIGNLSGGEGLGMSSDAKAAPLVNPKMVSNIDKASSLGEVIASLSDKDNGFEIMLEPSANFTDILFTLDGQEQHYRNGRTSWNRFSWPGTTTAPGARLDVVTLTGERITVFDYTGRWGLLRMNDSARVSDLDGIQQRFSWNTAKGQVSLVVRNYGGVKLTDLANVKALSALNSTDGRTK
ncbi:type VI secretion protein IcmF/TssM N-terminal domain-containing protein [Pseudomonas alliivorans]|nr:type VI secretion protein IcmF/TssM N-terminal domain-containing protein [Pseudomonas alliivorans]MEE4780738.1 type VI secretion protein IcmF/TssM N-terminal domain-containing protein [Pseudomonas alliivorans]MEE4861496.1 type VI secretion protein IcmF/TssM N-terminal domain-containing protein [Pseudomonas alliivorans]MEE4907384.1 type VI secretion protein IcmF/TssM N-terminal domain-containing protein [Pseudomonas alliivorans]MEE5041474.1 type VI secretion protein IcmF/TssM N-terminal domai